MCITRTAILRLLHMRSGKTAFIFRMWGRRSWRSWRLRESVASEYMKKKKMRARHRSRKVTRENRKAMQAEQVGFMLGQTYRPWRSPVVPPEECISEANVHERIGLEVTLCTNVLQIHYWMCLIEANRYFNT